MWTVTIAITSICNKLILLSTKMNYSTKKLCIYFTYVYVYFFKKNTISTAAANWFYYITFVPDYVQTILDKRRQIDTGTFIAS